MNTYQVLMVIFTAGMFLVAFLTFIFTIVGLVIKFHKQK